VTGRAIGSSDADLALTTRAIAAKNTAIRARIIVILVVFSITRLLIYYLLASYWTNLNRTLIFAEERRFFDILLLKNELISVLFLRNCQIACIIKQYLKEKSIIMVSVQAGDFTNENSRWGKNGRVMVSTFRKLNTS
jgi:hypothetical protein